MIYNPKQQDKRLQPFHKGVPLPGFPVQEYKTKTPAHAQSRRSQGAGGALALPLLRRMTFFLFLF